MKTILLNFLAAMLVAVSLQTHGQSTLTYDQQSATGTLPSYGNDFFYLQQDSPLTQSFIPTLLAIDFVQFEFQDVANNGTNGATVYVNLWTASPNTNSATLLGSTAPVYMPNGFMDNGLGLAGVTNFYFSTPIALTSGQTYYLQPVVSSGDNPWAIMVLTNTYANGELFENGYALQPGSDLWFREGVTSVPEPATLALAGLSCILIFSRKCFRRLLLVLGLFITTLASASQVYYLQSMGGVGASPPFPMNPDPSTAATQVSPGVYLVEDGSSGSGSQSHAMAGSRAMVSSVPPSFTDTNNSDTNQTYQPQNYTPIFDTNGLWLEASNETPNLGLRLHNPNGENYQLLSTSNLLCANWTLGQILFGASGDYADFTPVPFTGPATFFYVHQANPVMAILDEVDSREPDSTNNDPGQNGLIEIVDEGSATNDLIVYYGITGTAQNGIDYSNLTGTVTVPASQGSAQIYINPIADGLKPNQTIVLTLLQNTNYLIDPAYYSATNNLAANPQVVPVANGDLQDVCPNISSSFQLDAYDPRGLPLTYSILTYPSYGTLTGTPPYMTYTPTNCFEGADSFTFTASDGQFSSAPVTVPLVVSDSPSSSPVSMQTCRGTPVGFSLDAGDGCGETLYYQVSAPQHGAVTNMSGQATDPNFIYTPTGTNFTGVDTFNYVAFTGCGDATTNTVTITVGGDNINPIFVNAMTATNRPLTITLGENDYDNCTADTDDYIYTIVSGSGPTNGTLTGTPPNVVYTPANGFEGADSFQFTVSDGVWTSSPATVNIDVVAGPLLTAGSAPCYPFGTAVQLAWSLDTNVQQTIPQSGLNISDFVVYRATNISGPFLPIATNNASTMNYFDATAIAGLTNYYVVTFDSSASGVTYASPDSDIAMALGNAPDDLIPSDAVWQVVTNLTAPNNVVSMQTPFSSLYPSQYPGIYPLPNTNWPINTTWSNSIALYLPSNTVLAQVQYSIAIDNNYWLYANGVEVGTGSNTNNNNSFAVWPSFQTFPTNTLHYGANNISVVIQDIGYIDYFSMVVTTNTCGQ